MDIKKIISSKTIIVLILLIILTLSILGVITAGKKQSIPIVKEHREVDTSIIFEKMEKISELSVIKYYYSDVVVYKNNKKLKEFDIPFTQKSFLVKYDGYIKAGIEAGSIRIVSNDDEGIKLIIKNSKILDHVIDENSLYVYDESSLFNKLSFKDIIEQIASEKSNVENSLIEKGFLREADNNLKIYLKEALEDLGFERVEVYFEVE